MDGLVRFCILYCMWDISAGGRRSAADGCVQGRTVFGRGVDQFGRFGSRGVAYRGITDSIVRGGDCDPQIHIGYIEVSLSHGDTKRICLLYPADVGGVNSGTVEFTLA